MAAWLANPRRRAVIVLIATVVSMAITARLGVWQLSRAAQKQALQSAQDARGGLTPLEGSSLPTTESAARAQHFRPVRLQGEWKQGATVFLENRQMNGRVGFFVVTPLMLGPNDAVLVQRGWSPRDLQDRLRVQPVPTPAGQVVVQGLLAPTPGRLFDFAGAASGPIRQNLPLDEFSRELGVSLRPWSVQQFDSPGTAGDGLLRQWPAPATDIHKHYGYAVQWFSLCALLAGLYVWFQLIAPRRKRSV